MQPAPSKGFHQSAVINKLFHQAGARSFCILPHHQSVRSLNLSGKRTDTMPASQHTSSSSTSPNPIYHLSVLPFHPCSVYIIQNFNSFHHAKLRQKWHWKCTKCYTPFTQQTLPNLFQPFHLYFSSKQFSQPSFIYFFSQILPLVLPIVGYNRCRN